MMSSEEETDCFGLYGDKLSKKAKRARQRVDAGEPRNSYSSIPNFTSRPSFMSGGIYGAIFDQSRQHFGLFGPGYGPAKMLNELLGRQAKQAAETEADDGPTGDIAHRMLRGILQGRKKDLRASPDNNNSIHNNNNDELKDSSDDCDVKRLNGLAAEDGNSADEARAAAAAMQDCLQEAGIGNKQQQAELLEEAMLGMNGGADSRSLPSPSSVEALVTPKIELDHENDKAVAGSPTPAKSDQMPIDMKRARVENIVSTMRSSPVLPTQPQVNGCKKRKLYQPQQHDNSAAERYSAASLSLNLNLQNLMMEDDDDDELDRPPMQQKLVRNALKTQLRSMQEQLAEMQQKYVHLWNRIELESETHENEEVTSDMEQDIISNHAEKSSPATSPNKEMKTQILQANTTPNMLSQVRTKMMTTKVHSHLVNPHGIPHGYNGAIPLMQHMATAVHDHPHQMQHPNQPHPHHAISNAAAMYLGVSQKLFMEQEARMVKEAAVAAAHAAEQQHQQNQAAHQQHQQQKQHQQQLQQQSQQQQQLSPHSVILHPGVNKHNIVPSEITERMNMHRNNSNAAVGATNDGEIDGLADVLKSELIAMLTKLIDSIVTRFIQQRRIMVKQSEAAAAAAEQLNKDLLLASQLLERESPRLKPNERPTSGQSTGNASNHPNLPPNANINLQNNMINIPHNVLNPINSLNPNMQMNGPHLNGAAFPAMNMALHMPSEQAGVNSMNQNPHQRPSASGAMFQAPKPPQGLSPAAAALYSMGPFCMPEREQNPEQNEALSLVVTAKKKRHKVTDTRITPRTVSRILAQDGLGPSPGLPDQSKPFGDSPSPMPYHPPQMLPVSLPTSVAIPNPSLHDSQVFSPYSPFYHHARGRMSEPVKLLRGGSPGRMETRDSPPLPHPPALLHPALLAAAHHGSPDYGHMRPQLDSTDPNSDCNSTDIAYDVPQSMLYNMQALTSVHSSTLTPMHLRKAKLMFFWVRYPSSAVLKMYFPDIKFNKNNTAQLVKWFSNFREFYYIQMEKYARQAVSEGVKNADELHVAGDSEIYRVLNLHYNRNNHIEVPSNFRYVVEQTLREFYRAIQGGKDTEQSWKKSIYKIISRLDDPVPEYFKSPNFLEQLE